MKNLAIAPRVKSKTADGRNKDIQVDCRVESLGGQCCDRPNRWGSFAMFAAQSEMDMLPKVVVRHEDDQFTKERPHGEDCIRMMPLDRREISNLGAVVRSRPGYPFPQMFLNRPGASAA
jgi:hypothetical protein